MQLTEALSEVKGHWLVEVYEGDIERDGNGEIRNRLVETFEGDNLVTTTGKGLLLDRLFGITATAINSMGVGASATAAAVGDTQLGTTPTIQALDTVPPVRAGLVVTCISTFATGTANITWQELGLFNGTVNGTSVMLNRIAPIGPFTKTSAVSIVVTVTVTQS